MQRDPQLIEELNRLTEPYTSGDSMCPLRWTRKSTSELARELNRRGHPISPDSVGRLLKADGYSLQGNRKRFEGQQHPERNAQFEQLATAVETFQSRGSPVISVGAKKKELVGNYRNAGQEWMPQGEPLEVEAYDFVNDDLGKATQEGIRIMVCHLPPGTSKWNRIEHRMVCHITRNWRDKPLISHEVIIQLIAATSTEKGLRIQAELDAPRIPHPLAELSIAHATAGK